MNAIRTAVVALSIITTAGAGGLASGKAQAGSRAPARAAPKPAKPLTPVKNLMEERINPAMTALSFALYHTDKGDQLTPEVLDALVQLSETSTELIKNADRYSDDPSFRAYSVELQIAAQGLIDSYSAQEDTAAISHWFAHARATCNSCHATFRE